MAWSGTVEALYLTAEKSAPMRCQPALTLIAGRGIEGDRYLLKSGTYSHMDGPDRQVTIIEREVLEAVRRDHDIEITPGECRRNVIVRGIPLAYLVGVEFSLGGAVLRGVRLNQPCKYLNMMLKRDVFLPLYNRSGINCEVIEGGEVRAGDRIWSD